MKRGIITIIICALFFATVPAKATLVDSNSIIQDGIEYYIQTDKSVYKLGENVEMLFRVTNLRDETVLIGCSQSPEFNLLGKRDEEILWLANNSFLAYSPGVVFSAGEFKILPANNIWDMTDYNGRRIEPGIYSVIGIMYNQPWNYYNHKNYIPTEVEVSITIIPEPSSLAFLGMGLAGLLVRSKKRKGIF
jgi:hypothetical protein